MPAETRGLLGAVPATPAFRELGDMTSGHHRPVRRSRDHLQGGGAVEVPTQGQKVVMVGFLALCEIAPLTRNACSRTRAHSKEEIIQNPSGMMTSHHIAACTTQPMMSHPFYPCGQVVYKDFKKQN